MRNYDFYVAVVQKRQTEKCTEKCDAHAKSLSCLLNLLFFLFCFGLFFFFKFSLGCWILGPVYIEVVDPQKVRYM